MPRRPAGVKTFVNVNSADVLVVDFENGGNIYSFNLSWIGQTVGDRVVIYDAITNDPTADKLFEFVIPTAAGSFAAVVASVGKVCKNGIFFNPNVSDPAAGKLKAEIGYDGA